MSPRAAKTARGAPTPTWPNAKTPENGPKPEKQYCDARFFSSLLKEGRQHREVHYAFEKGDREHEIKKIFADWNSKNSEYKGLRSHTFLPKNTTLLQPADLVAGIVQRCVVSAFNAFPSLDNGLARTRLQTFDRHYSGDGVTATIVSGHDHDKCWIVNPKSFDFLDQIGSRFFERHPDQLKKRMKQSPYKPKSAEKPTV